MLREAIPVWRRLGAGYGSLKALAESALGEAPRPGGCARRGKALAVGGFEELLLDSGRSMPAAGRARARHGHLPPEEEAEEAAVYARRMGGVPPP